MKSFELFTLFIKWDVGLSAVMGSNTIDRRIFQIQLRSLKKYQMQILLPNTICLEMSAPESALFKRMYIQFCIVICFFSVCNRNMFHVINNLHYIKHIEPLNEQHVN